MLYTDSTMIDAVNSGDDMPETIYDPFTGEPGFSVAWHSTDAWRGYYETIPLVEGWEKVDEGAVCGEWDDVPPGTRSSDVEAKLNALAETDDILVIIAPTSNVFSMGYDAYRRVAA